jgi:diguanylate cyclase (GGDEF)-like protein
LKNRKLIGVIISEVEELYQQKLLKGIISESYALNYDVAIFSTFIKNTGLPEYKFGEKNIYNLMNFEHFDGIIVAGLTLRMDKLKQEIETMLLSKCNCPVLYVDSYSEKFPYIYTNDRTSMEQLTDHLIECHGYKNIFCLAGAPNLISTINRVAGFKDSLRKHKLPVEDSKISYEGGFYYPGGEELARKIINGEIVRPEAVVCLNDHMAIGMVNEFTRNGIRVPEDIAVTGYDATEEADTCSTVITTFSPPIMQTGIDAVCELTRLMTGIRPNPSTATASYLEIGRSCGCYDIDYYNRSGILSLKEKTQDYKILLDSYMTEALTAVTSFEDCITKFNYYLYLIKDYSDYYLCLCDNWDGSAHNYSTEKEPVERKVGYTDKMQLVLATGNKKVVESEDCFDVSDMLPDLWKIREKPKAYYFTPIHFNENTLGYAVLSYGDRVEAFDITYRNWSRNIMNALEFNRVHRKLYRSSFRDVLTGIYNRSGFDQNLTDIINEVMNQNKKLLVIMADLDNLKSINDRFGHQEGDNVITVVANAFQSCCHGNEICARIGGDEFLVMGADEEGGNSEENFMSSVNRYIEKYNHKSKKPYAIEISMGAYCNYINDNTDIKEMIDLADQAMYINKAMNKRCRR